MHEDHVLNAFLDRQKEEALQLAAESDLLELLPLDGPPPQHYIARFSCRGLVCLGGSDVSEAENFEIGIWLPDDYLRRVDPLQIITVLRPPNIWHPNVLGFMICLGRLTPGMPLVDILYQCYDILSFHKWSPHDGLNELACQWARSHQEKFPVDTRPLKRRKRPLEVEATEKEEEGDDRSEG